MSAVQICRNLGKGGGIRTVSHFRLNGWVVSVFVSSLVLFWMNFVLECCVGGGAYANEQPENGGWEVAKEQGFVVSMDVFVLAGRIVPSGQPAPSGEQAAHPLERIRQQRDS